MLGEGLEEIGEEDMDEEDDDDGEWRESGAVEADDDDDDEGGGGSRVTPGDVFALEMELNRENKKMMKVGFTSLKCWRRDWSVFQAQGAVRVWSEMFQCFNFRPLLSTIK